MTSDASELDNLRDIITGLYSKAIQDTGDETSLLVSFENDKDVTKEVMARLVNHEGNFTPSGKPETFTVLLTEGKYIAGTLRITFSNTPAENEVLEINTNYGYSVVTCDVDKDSVEHYAENEAPIESDKDLANFAMAFHKAIENKTFVKQP